MKALNWTDDDLVRAVPVATSWTSLIRLLGGSSTSAGRRIRIRVDALRLDTSHFRGQRTWSDDDLAEAVLRSTTWSEVASRLGQSANSETLARVKAHALRLTLDVGKFTPVVREAGLRTFGDPSDLNVGQESPFLAAAWFARRGNAVMFAAEGAQYDLLVETSEHRFARMQVKSGGHLKPSGRREVKIHRLAPSSGRGKARTSRPYDPEDLDYFFVVAAEAYYLIPIGQVAGMIRVTVGLDSPWVAERRVMDARTIA